MKKLHLFLHDRRMGTVRVDRVRGHETWTFSYDADYLDASTASDRDVCIMRRP